MGKFFRLGFGWDEMHEWDNVPWHLNKMFGSLCFSNLGILSIQTFWQAFSDKRSLASPGSLEKPQRTKAARSCGAWRFCSSFGWRWSWVITDDDPYVRHKGRLGTPNAFWFPIIPRTFESQRGVQATFEETQCRRCGEFARGIRDGNFGSV